MLKLLELILEYIEIDNETHTHSKHMRKAELREKLLVAASNIDDKLLNLTQRTNKY